MGTVAIFSTTLSSSLATSKRNVLSDGPASSLRIIQRQNKCDHTCVDPSRANKTVVHEWIDSIKAVRSRGQDSAHQGDTATNLRGIYPGNNGDVKGEAADDRRSLCIGTNFINELRLAWRL